MMNKEELNAKFAEPTQEELTQVTGGREYTDREVDEDIRLWPYNDPKFRNYQ